MDFWKTVQWLQEEEKFCDISLTVSLDVDSPVIGTVHAHKVVLVACSRFFHNLLKAGDLFCEYSFVGVSLESLQLVVDYMYRRISWEELIRVPEAATTAYTIESQPCETLVLEGSDLSHGAASCIDSNSISDTMGRKSRPKVSQPSKVSRKVKSSGAAKQAPEKKKSGVRASSGNSLSDLPDTTSSQIASNAGEMSYRTSQRRRKTLNYKLMAEGRDFVEDAIEETTPSNNKRRIVEGGEEGDSIPRSTVKRKRGRPLKYLPYEETQEENKNPIVEDGSSSTQVDPCIEVHEVGNNVEPIQQTETGETQLSAGHHDDTDFPSTQDGVTEHIAQPSDVEVTGRPEHLEVEECNIPDEGEVSYIPEESEECNIPEEREECNISEEREECNIPEEREECNIPEEREECNIPEEREECNIPEEREECNIPEEREECNISEKGEECNIPDSQVAERTQPADAETSGGDNAEIPSPEGHPSSDGTIEKENTEIDNEFQSSEEDHEGYAKAIEYEENTSFLKTNSKNLKTINENPKIVCGKCKMVFKTRVALNIHIKTIHDIIRKLECSMCDDVFDSNVMVEKHMAIVHGLNRFQCPDCNMHFRSKEGCNVHWYKKHSGQEPKFSCEQCQMKFYLRGELRSHIQYKHTAEREFACTQCPRAFKSNAMLQRHLNTYHSDIRKFKCDVCGLMFKTMNVCKSHRRRHFREKNPLSKDPNAKVLPKEDNYPCSFCDKVFHKRSRKLVHENLQHKQKNDGTSFLCTLCSKVFAIKHYLMQHIKHCHSGRRYSCPVCLQTFTQKVDVKKHFATPGRCKGAPPDPKPFSCHQCGKGFSLKGNLGKHLQRPGRCRGANTRNPDVIVVLQRSEEQVKADGNVEDETEIISAEDGKFGPEVIGTVVAQSLGSTEELGEPSIVQIGDVDGVSLQGIVNGEVVPVTMTTSKGDIQYHVVTEVYDYADASDDTSEQQSIVAYTTSEELEGQHVHIVEGAGEDAQQVFSSIEKIEESVIETTVSADTIIDSGLIIESHEVIESQETCEVPQIIEQEYSETPIVFAAAEGSSLTIQGQSVVVIEPTENNS